MSTTNINIYLHGEETGNATAPQEPNTTPNANDPTKNKGDDGKGKDKSIAMLAGAYLAQQGFSMATSRVGETMRSGLSQQHVGSTLKVGAYIGAIAASPVLGSLALAIDVVGSLLDYNHKARQETRALDIMNARTGNINRSR